MQRQPLLRQSLSQTLVFIHIDLGHGNRALGLGHGRFQRRAQGFAGPAPGRPEIDDHRRLHRGLDHILHKGRLADVHDQITCGGWRARTAKNIHHLNLLRFKLGPYMEPRDAETKGGLACCPDFIAT